MMVWQKEERVELYRRRDPWGDPRGDPLPINLQATMIPDAMPLDHKTRDMARELTNGQAGGASKMRMEDIKLWLRGNIVLEEDPKKGPTMWGKGISGASLSASSRWFGCTVRSRNNSPG
jgi:hypothetical protein